MEKLASQKTIKLALTKGFKLSKKTKYSLECGDFIRFTNINYYKKIKVNVKPTLSYLFNWLRIQHNLFIVIHTHDKNQYSYNIENLNGKFGTELIYSTILDSIVTNKYFPSYEEALELAIQKSLTFIN